MSDAPAPAAPIEHQFKVKLPDDVLLRLAHQSEALGFHTENALAAVALKAFSRIPAAKVWQVLAALETQAKGQTTRRRSRR